MEEQKIQRLNLFATLAGMAAVIFFLITLVVAIFFPPLLPADTPPTASLIVTANNAFSALGSPQEVEKALKTGFNDFLEKPSSAEILFERIQKHTAGKF